MERGERVIRVPDVNVVEMTAEYIEQLRQNSEHIAVVVKNILWPWLRIKPSANALPDLGGVSRLSHYFSSMEVQHPELLAIERSAYVVDKTMFTSMIADEVQRYKNDVAVEGVTSYQVLEAFGKIVPQGDDDNFRGVYFGCMMARFLRSPSEFKDKEPGFINNPVASYNAALAGRSKFPFSALYPIYFTNAASAFPLDLQQDPIVRGVPEIAYRQLLTWHQKDVERHLEICEVREGLCLEDIPNSDWVAEAVMREMAQVYIFAPGSLAVSEEARLLLGRQGDN